MPVLYSLESQAGVVDILPLAIRQSDSFDSFERAMKRTCFVRALFLLRALFFEL